MHWIAIKYINMIINILSNISFVFNWNHFEMRLLNLRINFHLLLTFCPYLGSFCVVSSFTTFRPNFSPLTFFRGFTATSDRNL